MKKIFFLKPLFNFIGIGLLITTLSRLFLFFIFKERVVETSDFWYIFPIGLRMDLILLCYLSFLPAVIITFLPNKWLRFTNSFLVIYTFLFLFLILFVELATPDFVKQYDTRPNKIFLDYLIYPKEVIGMLLKSYLTSIIITFLILGGVLYLAFKKGKGLFYTLNADYKFKLMVFPLVSFLLFFGARSSLTSKRPINASNAVFSTDQLTNVLGLNSFYTVAFAAYSIKNEGNTKMYGKMDEAEAFARVKKYMIAGPSDFTDKNIPFLHVQLPDTILKKPYNLVIFLQESLGAEYVGILGGKPLTPEFDKLSKEGLLFTNLYCTGTRSVRGIEAVVTGFLPSPSESVVKMGNSQQGFFTLADALEQKGYDTSFIYGGMANFDNMASFFNGNGFENIIDETDFESDGNKYAFKGTWGYSDEDLVIKANDYFKSKGDKPFFSLMFSTSNHEPFEYPAGRIKQFDKKAATVNNAMKYADFSIGKFFEMAKKEAYFKNTIFIVIADHNTRTYGKNLVPINKFHIPAFIIGPGVPKGTVYNKLASQIDIPPTLLSYLGLSFETPMMGRNLNQLDSKVQGRSIMQFNDINAFRVGNQVVIMQPNLKALQFEIKNDTTLIPVKLNVELAKDALAHVITAGNLYKENKYKLRSKG
ncbi:LTA synthase family protein [Flavobacterium piscis]|uniref:Phosphoglycerol transferase MdoB-like AlkP superfamily enzyme n=1 Tax=Flavobacterium piscis TaxID=1114874 RepID=A0ABU1YAT2_9FLAO|nr:LTA synthase family protein [Flavobacterium piscis]MDR7210745.1 phosphoglycerol transferase MdoB-like AlkP superfamily enzyme [Flavobacterium piscis]